MTGIFIVLILLYIGLCFYTLFIWVTLLNRLRQKRYKSAFYRSIGFLMLLRITAYPLLTSGFPPIILLITLLLFIIASFFSTAVPKPKTKKGVKIKAYQPITPDEIQGIINQPQPEFYPKSIAQPKTVKLLEQKSELLWSNYQEAFQEKFWNEYEEVLVKMKKLD